MANFSFGKFFGKSPRQPRFSPVPPEGARGAADANEALPVGRLVSFTDHGPEDAPLFQELDAPPASPFAVVGGTRSNGANGANGGLPGPARVSVEEGFTADELTAMVPAQCVRAGAVPANQVIPLPLPVLRASLGAGQPAVLLSQLHQACPELFRAPTSLDQDLVIALPPQKVQRLVARAEAGGAVPGGPPNEPPGLPSAPATTDLTPVGWSGHGPSAAFDDAGLSALGGPPSRVKLPPRRRKFDELHGGDLRPLMDRIDSPPPAASDSFSDLGNLSEAEGTFGSAPPSFPSPFQKPAAPAPASSPFQVTSALPQGQPPRGGIPKRFESPFAIVAAGDIPSVLESPFARHPVAGFDAPSEPPGGPGLDPLPQPYPEPPSTVSLRLAALLQGQNAGTLGFAPERVPHSVRVTLATTPLLLQVASGRIRVRLEDVVAGLGAKFQPAFKGAQPGLELHVPLRELFDNLPEAAPPTPAAPPVPSAFETPFSVRADEDTSLTVANSPFQLAPPVPPAAPASLPELPPALAEALRAPASEPIAPPPPVPLTAATLPAAPESSLIEPPVVTSHEPFVVVPEAPSPSPAPIAVAPLDAASAPPRVSPFLLIPADTSASSPLPVPPPTAAMGTGETAVAPPAQHAPIPSAPAEPPSEPAPALAIPPAQIPLPTPLRNPFALAPGDGIRAGLGLELPMMPYDEDPVPLESLREEEPAYRIPPTTPSAPPPATPSPAAAPADKADAPPPENTQPVEKADAPALPSTPTVADEVPAAVAPAAPRLPIFPTPPALPPLLFVESPPETPDAPESLKEPEPPAVTPPPVVRIALSEREPIAPPSEPAFEAAPGGSEPVAVSHVDILPPLFQVAPPDAAPSSEAVPESPAATSAPLPPTPPASSPFLDSSSFQLPPLPFELLGKSPAVTPETAPAASIAPHPVADQPPAEDTPFLPPSLADAPPFTVGGPRPTDDDRAAFASVFAPSALARTPDGTLPPLGEMDAVPAITLAKLPPIGEEPPAPPALAALHIPIPAPTPPDEPIAPPALGFSFTPPAPIEDLSFGYVDNPTQLALRAVFATDRTLGTQEVVDLAAQLEGLRACLVHTPHASLHSAPSPDDSDDVRHFRERAGTLFEKTASLVANSTRPPANKASPCAPAKTWSASSPSMTSASPYSTPNQLPPGRPRKTHPHHPLGRRNADRLIRPPVAHPAHPAAPWRSSITRPARSPSRSSTPAPRWAAKRPTSSTSTPASMPPSAATSCRSPPPPTARSTSISCRSRLDPDRRLHRQIRALHRAGPGPLQRHPPTGAARRRRPGFVADSAADRLEENLESARSLMRNLQDNATSLEHLPLVLQYNKRDLPEAAPRAQLDYLLNRPNVRFPYSKQWLTAASTSSPASTPSPSWCCGSFTKPWPAPRPPPAPDPAAARPSPRDVARPAAMTAHLTLTAETVRPLLRLARSPRPGGGGTPRLAAPRQRVGPRRNRRGRPPGPGRKRRARRRRLLRRPAPRQPPRRTIVQRSALPGRQSGLPARLGRSRSTGAGGFRQSHPSRHRPRLRPKTPARHRGRRRPAPRAASTLPGIRVDARRSRFSRIHRDHHRPAPGLRRRF
jgi:hypothetical protein